MDLAVIGGGFTGLSAAYHALAAHPGMRVVVLEGERIGHGASSRNTGMLTPGVGQNLAALVKRFGADAARAMYERSLEAVEYVGELAEREQIDARLRMTGQLVVAHGRSGRRRLARQADLMESLELPCERLDDNGLQPAPPPGNHRPGGEAEGPAALRLPVAGILDPGRLVAGLSAAVQRHGGRIIEGAKVISVSRGTPVRVRLADGRELVANHVVVASSGYAGALNLQSGRLVPLAPAGAPDRAPRRRGARITRLAESRRRDRLAARLQLLPPDRRQSDPLRRRATPVRLGRATCRSSRRRPRPRSPGPRHSGTGSPRSRTWPSHGAGPG